MIKPSPCLTHVKVYVYFSIYLINPSSKLQHNFKLPLKSRSWNSDSIPLYFWNNQEHSRVCSQYLPFLLFRLESCSGWFLFELNSFRLLHQAVLVSGELWAGNWPASNLSAAPRPVKSSTSPPLSQLTELWGNISFLSFSWPFCSLRKEGDGLYWPCSLRCSFLGNWTSATRGFSGVSPRGCGAGTHLRINSEKAGGMKGRYKL